MSRRTALSVAALSAVLLLIAAWAPAGAAAATRASAQATVPPAVPGTSSHFQLVGKNPLFHRRMNAALTIFDHYLYVGNRTDGSNTCPDGTTGCPHPHPGVLILDISDPAHPEAVGQIGPPLEGNVGITSREPRVWPQKKLLMVMNFRCSHAIHACPAGTDAQFPFDFKFYDLEDPVHPRFIESYVPTSAAGRQVKPHEMFLWVDPNDEDRALLYVSTPTLSADQTVPNLMVVDISAVPDGGPVREVAEGNWNDQYPGTDQANYPFDPNGLNGCGPYDCNLITHSMGVTADGTTTYLAQEAGQFLALNTSAVASAPSPPTSVISLNGDLLTDPTNRPVWLQQPADPAAVPANCPKNCPKWALRRRHPGHALRSDHGRGVRHVHPVQLRVPAGVGAGHRRVGPGAPGDRVRVPDRGERSIVLRQPPRRCPDGAVHLVLVAQP